MRSINKSLQQPIIAGSVMADTDMISDNASNMSNMSNMSNISNISNSSLYTIRQERRTDLVRYLKQMSRTYLSELSYHLGLTVLIALVSGIIGTSVLYGWSLIVSGFFIIIYGVMVSSNIFSIIKVWRKERSEGVDIFWGECLVLAYKNALILQEYIDVYSYLSRSNNRRRVPPEENETFMIDDPTFELIHPSEIKKILKRVHSYIRLAYELTHLQRSDHLILRNNKVYCNVSDQSLTNQRNRQIENILNSLTPEKRSDIVDGWNAIDKKESTRYQSLSFIPFRWMINEYRNLFRYLYSSPDLRKIYNNVGLNFESYEQSVTHISRSLHLMRTDNVIYPADMRDYTLRVGDLFSLSTDLFYGISIAESVSFTGVMPMILTSVSSILIGGVMHVITMLTLYELDRIIRKNRSEELTNNKIDLIMKEISVICC